MTDTPRLGMTLIEGTDTIPAPGGMKDKVNAAITKLDAASGRVICTSTTRPTTNLFPGMQAYETDTKRNIVSPRGILGEWYIENQNSIGAGMVRALRPVRAFGLDSNHSAFPSAVTLIDGTILMVYRQGTDHVAARDGIIRMSRSFDQGRTWSAVTTILTGSPAGTDLRDPCVSLSRDGTKIYLTYFKGTAALGAAGVFFRVSTDGGTTWDAEIRVDTPLPYAASSAPVVELNTGTLVIPYYGRSGAETFDSIWVAKSVNQGATWVSTRILNGQTATTNYQEPYIAMKGTVGAMGYRSGGASNVGISTTTDNTANWSGASITFTGTGRPALFYVNDASLVCVYRRLSNGDAVTRTSQTNGAIWLPERLLDPAQSASGWMTYSGGDKVGPTAYFCVVGQEVSLTNSRIYLTYIGEAGTNTPYGPIPTDALAQNSNYDSLLFSTMFEQADGALVAPWTMATGSVTVENGTLKSTLLDNIIDIARVYVSVNDMEVEAEFSNGEGGFESGSAVIARMINANSYLMFTTETSGVNFRLYKVVSGVATQLATTSGQMAFNTYNRFKIICRGQEIRCIFNDAAILYHLMSGGDYSTFSTGMYAGVKLNSQGTTVHRCRRFLVRG